MKKTIFILSAVFFLTAAQAQKARVGITTGLTYSNIYDNVEGNDKTDAKRGLSLGMILDAPICTGAFSFQPTLQYVQKGTVWTNYQAEKTSWALRYAELQANFLFNTNKKNGGFFVGLGPAASYAVPSKKVVENNEGTSEKALTFGDEAINDYRRLDLGANGIIGYRDKMGWLLAVNYTYGLRNQHPGGGDTKYNNASVGIKIGYLFKN
ncbi:MAG: PorT family protein [Chitinophagaceae bacterium]|nr:PorT family protein [Chitinophagaceae bacterium]MBK8953823.1 PorT family protein [Chitinophagaceae bacterium]